MMMRAHLLLAALVMSVSLSCGGTPARTPEPTSAQRFNAEGIRRLERGELDGAVEMFRAALREAELVDDLIGQAEAWNNLGAVAMAHDAPQQAWSNHSNALRLYRAAKTRDLGEVHTLTNLGSAMLAAGRPELARRQFEEAINLGESLGDSDAITVARVGLAAVSLQNGDFAEAQQQARAAARAARQQGDDATLAAALAVQGAAAEGTGELDTARERFIEALEIDRKREVPHAVRDHLRALARVAQRSNDVEEAATLLTRSARISRWLGQLDAAEAELNQARELAGQGSSAELDDAIQLERRLLEVARDQAAPPQPASPLPAEEP
jgi:tetratricopeptide (TPR) repeat protein